MATKPLLFSHSSARTVCDHVRNVPDDVMLRISGNGGVCKVTFVASFISKDVHVWESEELPARLAQAGIDAADDEAVTAYERSLGSAVPAATVQQVADHVEHVRVVCGVQGVGIGGDYDGCRTLARGLEDVNCYPALLVGHGWSEDELGALTWRNAMRVLRGG